MEMCLSIVDSLQFKKIFFITAQSFHDGLFLSPKSLLICAIDRLAREEWVVGGAEENLLFVVRNDEAVKPIIFNNNDGPGLLLLGIGSDVPGTHDTTPKYDSLALVSRVLSVNHVDS